MTRARRLSAGLAGLVLAGCTAVPSAPTTTPPGTVTPSTAAPSASTPATPTPTPSPADRCLAAAESLSPKVRVGQLIMVGVNGGLDAAERRAITRYQVGSVVLLGEQGGGVKATATLTARLAKLNPKAALLVAADQEGGLVQRLTGPGFSTIPSATRQARMSDAELRQAAARWGGQLARAGVLLNLAPVADVVPAAKRSTNAPIGRLQRGYGADPDKVAAKTAAVIAGLGDSGVGASVKHFPGLGEVVGNTDHTGNVVDRVTRASSASLAPFRAAAEAGVGSVMISSATYTKIDVKRQAVFSPKVIGLLRDWGYEGVVISDDLGAAVAVRKVPAAQRAVRFLAAGGDVVINADPALTAAMAGGVLKRAGQDPDFAAAVTESAARVLRLKQELGLYDCG